ncbi:MAG: T9SS type A sorting domain-containing protein [Bacteroidales bacterium]|nr:T9SS type A sorting domain-containing protein [Bacteroidales bacterium]
MKNVNKILMVLILLLSNALKAQTDDNYIPLIKEGEQVWIWDVSTDGAKSFYRAETSNDTTIDGTLYKIIDVYCMDYSVMDSTHKEQFYKVFMRESNKQVFVLGAYGEQLLYDFALNIQDTFLIGEVGYPLQVQSIDTIEVANGKRRQWTLSCQENNVVAKWIEGIGNTEGLLFDVLQHFVTGGSNGHLRCYEYEGVLIYHDSSKYNDCENHLLGLNNIDDNNITSVYPNPAKDVINISSSEVIHSLKITNFAGQTVYSSTENSKTATINTASFEKGNYLVQIQTDKGQTTKKVVIE